MMKGIFLAALVALASACVFTGASRKSPDGNASWSSNGVALLESPADGYAKTAAADAALLTAQVIAQQQVAAAQAAVAAVQGDQFARGEIRATQEDLAKTDWVVDALIDDVERLAGRKGGAR